MRRFETVNIFPVLHLLDKTRKKRKYPFMHHILD